MVGYRYGNGTVVLICHYFAVIGPVLAAALDGDSG